MPEAYENAITSLDIGLVQRNLNYVPRIISLIDYFINKKQNKFLDYGGGYGLFVRLMRDKGYDFYRSDKYCVNLFANYFDCDDLDSRERFDLLTAFEVFEHISDPIKELEIMADFSEHIFFSTELLPAKESEISQWWYISPEIGQHISFYSKETLQYLAKRFGYNYYSDGKYFHFFTKMKISNYLFRFLLKKKVSLILGSFKSKSNSLLQSDYKIILNKLITSRETCNVKKQSTEF